ncbi:DEAD/DEAH box helicase [Abditibacterium utsteinense]|nr:DEAD/DEAH box helicase [Abditibacterium utsteinense]
MIDTVQDRSLPLNRAEFLRAEPPTGRVIIIAPTRAACETIEIGLTLNIETYLERTHGERVRELARSGAGFGIIAGTGTGKTLAVRPIAEEILRAPLKIGVVNREREATPELPTYNVIVVTTGVARRWFQDGDILPKDTLVIDEIHQTSAELELCLALGKRVGCRFIWLSATVDPRFYQKYLGSADVLQVFSFDPQKAADVRVINTDPPHFLGARFISQVIEEKRGVGVFLPTRAGVEEAANEVGARFPELNAAFYHGGEPVRVIRPFLAEDGAPKPYMLAMTAAGQSALNVRGLDTVVIDDTRFSNVIERGRNVLTRGHLGNNEILQMAGRVHGRVEGGRVFILSSRNIDFQTLRPTAPEFQLAGDSERVALTCADMGVRADELELPVPLDRTAYRRALTELQERGIINEAGKLTPYGKAVEALPVDRAWAELIVNGDHDLLPVLAVMSSIESLHRMTREERDIDDLIVPGSDHLTSYNLYAEAFERAGYIGEVYGLPRHFFEAEAIEKWAQERGVLTKSIEDAALAMACVLRGVKMPLPTQMPLADKQVLRRFSELLARYMPFDLVIDEETADDQIARLSKTSVCGNRGPIAGSLRYFASRDGASRAAIEGTQISLERLKKYAKRTASKLVYEPHRKPSPLVARWQVAYHGFVFERDTQPIEEFSPEIAPQARRVLAQALASFEAKHAASHTNRAAIEEVRELHRRSGGQTPSLDFDQLAAQYEAMLESQKIGSMNEFRLSKLPIRVEDFVSLELHSQLRALPSFFVESGQKIEIRYEIEEGRGVARLQLPEKMARTLREDELPKFDRPFRFAVNRGQRGEVRAATLEELREKLEGPWTPDAKSPQAARNAKREVERTVARAKPRGGMGKFKPSKRR